VKTVCFLNTKSFACASLAVAFAAFAAAQAPAQTKVGVIQIQAAIVSTKDGQRAAQDFETKFAPTKKELEKKQAEIKELQDKLQRGGSAMSETAKNDLARQIESKTKSYNYDMQDANAEAEQEQRKMIDELGQKLMPIIDKYAQTNGFSVILDVSNPNTPVLYASNSVDITKEIIDLYDKTAPAAAPAKPTAAPKAIPSVPAPKPAVTPAPAPAPKKQP
jgi:outer membrane protein